MDMNQLFTKNKEKIIDFLVLLGFSVFTYSELMVNQLVNNYDGIWEGNFHIAGAWELSIGRWFWHYLSKLRFGIAADPVVSIIALALFVLGIMFLVDLMGVKERLITYVAGAAFICSPLVCIDLSYRYMSPTFGTAFFLAVLAVWLAIRIKKAWLAVLVGGVVLALSLGSYQAYLGVACVVALAYFIKLLLGEDKLVDCLKKMLRPVLTILIGGILYVILLNIHLKMNHVQMSDYMGASEYSLGTILKYFPTSFKGMYQIFDLSMKEVLFKFNKLEKFHICLVLIVAFLGLYGFCFVKSKKKNIGKILCVLVAFLLIPPAAYAVKFITVDAPISLQMTGGFFIVVPSLLCAVPVSFDRSKLEKILALGVSLLVAAFAYGGFYQVQADQSAMYEGKKSVLALTDAIIDKTIDLNYFQPDYSYCFLGSPTGSKLYRIDEAAYNANLYAVFGAFWADYNGEKSWAGVIHDYKSLNLSIVSNEQYWQTVSREEVATMPVFPAEGSILLLDNVVVIKVSE